MSNLEKSTHTSTIEILSEKVVPNSAHEGSYVLCITARQGDTVKCASVGMGADTHEMRATARNGAYGMLHNAFARDSA